MTSFDRLAYGNMNNRAGDTLHFVENRLTQLVTSGGVTTDCAYNGDGALVKKVASGMSIFYEAFDFSKGEPSYSGPATSYQLNIRLGTVGVPLTNTVARPNGTVDGPLAPGAPQTITIGWAPGVGRGFSVAPIQTQLIAG